MAEALYKNASASSGGDAGPAPGAGEGGGEGGAKDDVIDAEYTDAPKNT
jgi:hypothetical protein